MAENIHHSTIARVLQPILNPAHSMMNITHAGFPLRLWTPDVGVMASWSSTCLRSNWR